MTDKKKQGKKEAPRPDLDQSTDDGNPLGSSGSKQLDAAGWEDVAKRALADLDNYKKQTEKDKFELLNIMKAVSLAKFMEVYDDLGRALEHVEGEAKEGLERVQKKFKDFLHSEGLEQIEFKEGEEFNPEFAEAVSHEENEVGNGKVIETVEVGLKYKDRVIKVAKVRVGK